MRQHYRPIDGVCRAVSVYVSYIIKEQRGLNRGDLLAHSAHEVSTKMLAASWAIVFLTIALILATAYYALQTRDLARDTKRMADEAERQSRERQERDKKTASGLAATVYAELTQIREQMNALEPRYDLAGTLGRNLQRLAGLPRTGRMFDMLLSQQGFLGSEVAQQLVDVYALVASIATKAEEFSSRGLADVSSGEAGQLSTAVGTLARQVDRVLAELRALPDS